MYIKEYTRGLQNKDFFYGKMCHVVPETTFLRATQISCNTC